MKRRVTFLLAAFAVAIGTICIAVNKDYKVLDIRGSIIVDNTKEALTKGQTIKGGDVLIADRQSYMKVHDTKRSYTLRVSGKHSVKELIDNMPNKYKTAISNIKDNLLKAQKTTVVYGVVTMDFEMDGFDLADNEGFVFCKEDSLGNLAVAFMRSGMQSPMMYTLSPQSYIYLLKMSILTVQGYDYAYEPENSVIYDVFWKPLEKYFQPGDIVMFSLPESLAHISMEDIPVDDTHTLSDLYELYQLDSYSE